MHLVQDHVSPQPRFHIRPQVRNPRLRTLRPELAVDNSRLPRTNTQDFLERHIIADRILVELERSKRPYPQRP